MGTEGIGKDLELIQSNNSGVLIVGLGISGLETARYLMARGIAVTGVDRASREKHASKREHAEMAKTLEMQGAKFYFATDGEDIAPLLTSIALAVVSPGVSLESSVIGVLKRHGIPAVSELELGIELLGVPTIVVTGSNGKSTTVSLIHHVLQSCGESAWLCGNVGTPVVSFAEQAVASGKPRWLVVEASSYQLEGCVRLRPRAGVFLNLTDNHLERHGSMERYFRAKAKLFAFQQGSDLAVANHDDSRGREVLKLARARTASFGAQESQEAINCGWVVAKDRVALRVDGGRHDLGLTGVQLMGAHNRSNIVAAAITLCSLGVPSEQVERALSTFSPLEHRLEIIHRPAVRPLTVNDSKSTTVAASIAAFEAIRDTFPNRKIRLMLGGLAKAGSWDPLMKVILRHVEHVAPIICFGGDRTLISSYCRTYRLPYHLSLNVQQAIVDAHAGAQPDEVILFSPGCASFDEFTDFEHRGSVFKSLLRDLDGEHVGTSSLTPT